MSGDINSIITAANNDITTEQVHNPSLTLNVNNAPSVIHSDPSLMDNIENSQNSSNSVISPSSGNIGNLNSYESSNGQLNNGVDTVPRFNDTNVQRIYPRNQVLSHGMHQDQVDHTRVTQQSQVQSTHQNHGQPNQSSLNFQNNYQQNQYNGIPYQHQNQRFSLQQPAMNQNSLYHQPSSQVLNEN